MFGPAIFHKNGIRARCRVCSPPNAVELLVGGDFNAAVYAVPATSPEGGTLVMLCAGHAPRQVKQQAIVLSVRKYTTDQLVHECARRLFDSAV